MKEDRIKTGGITTTGEQQKGGEGGLTQSAEARNQGGLTQGTGETPGGVTVAGSSSGGITVDAEEHSESVAIHEFERELTQAEIELVHQHRGFIVKGNRMTILPWLQNPSLKMNQRQAESLEIQKIEQKMPWTGGYIASVTYK